MSTRKKRKSSRRTRPQKPAAAEPGTAIQRVVIALPRAAGAAEEPYHALASQVEAALPQEYDGWGTDDRTVYEIFLHGPDANVIWRRARPIVQASELIRGARVELQYR